ncbi:MAG TPA: Rieske 2Fe-2S domain-containing protein [Minicystis sp.]|nr:Rieske 2Fe-2S domain-containing protein [Minicystis sp.]
MTDDAKRAADEPAGDAEPRWRADFPIRWERDGYVTRRELAKFLTLGSALLAGASGAIAIAGARVKKLVEGPRQRIAASADVPAGGSMLFHYPTPEDPCIAVRGKDGVLRAYSQVCTHLSCAVVHRPEEDELYCPCHHGHFSTADGRPTGGPPRRRLPLVHVEERDGAVFAVAKEL